MPYADVPAALAAVEASGAGPVVKAAIRFTALTAVRSGEARGARWGEADSLIFPGVRGRPVNSNTLIKALWRATGTDADVHGFRSSFRTWAAERSGATRDVAELALAHVVGGSVERSYARSDLFDPRRVLMDRWAAFVTDPVAGCSRLPGRVVKRGGWVGRKSRPPAGVVRSSLWA